VIGAEMKEASWLRHLGAAGSVSTWVIARRIPVVIGQIARLGWRSSPRHSLAVLVGTIVSALLAGLALVESVHVLGLLFGASINWARVHSAMPSVIVLVALYSARAGCDMAVSYGQAELQPRIKRLVEKDLYALMSRVQVGAFTDKDFADDFQRAADTGIGYLQQSVASSVAVVSSILTMISSASVLAYLHPLLLPLMLAAVAPSGLASVRSAKLEYRSRVAYSTMNRRQWILAWNLIDPDQAAELRACSAGPMLFGEHARISDAIRNERVRLGRAQAATAVWGRALSGIGTGTVYATLVWMLAAGWMPLARGVGAAMAVRSVQSALLGLVLSVHGLFEQSLWIGDMTRSMEQARARLPRVTGRPAPKGFTSLELRGVGFTYPGSTDEQDRKAALSEVSLSIRAGQVVALVGRNGAGKSTLVKILAGLIEPDAGQVLWDGVDVTAFDAASLAGRVAMCPQDPTLWPIPARANIAVSEPDTEAIDDRRVREAAEAAGAAETIDELAHGWETVLSPRFTDGVELSGGQRAKVAIARALYNTDVAMAILDEPTANLDPIAEAATYRTVMGLRERGIAVVLVSHRIGGVVGADQIVVFDHGRIVESGTHQQLMANRSHYFEMYSVQAEMYTTGQELARPTDSSPVPGGDAQ
jgi:ATP-binding cassette subfamily B protein